MIIQHVNKSEKKTNGSLNRYIKIFNLFMIKLLANYQHQDISFS